jgi:hypothetical protein
MLPAETHIKMVTPPVVTGAKPVVEVTSPVKDATARS